jgi:3-phytase
VVFGDSLSDTGNVFLATSVPSPQFPFQIPASPQWFMGRFTNGPVWHEILTAGLGLAPAAPSLAGGNNYAWGGAELGPGFALFGGVPNVGLQVEQFLATRSPEADQLFVIQGGNNDLIPPGAPADPTTLVDWVESYVRALADRGARHFLIPNSIILENTPGLNPPLDQFLFGPGDHSAAVAEIIEAGRTFNRLLKKRMMQLEKELAETHEGLTITQPAFGLAGRIVSLTGQRFGIDNVTEPALTASFNPACFCEGVVAEEPDRFYYFDIVHPGAVVHEQLGELAAMDVAWRLNQTARRDARGE